MNKGVYTLLVGLWSLWLIALYDIIYGNAGRLNTFLNDPAGLFLALLGMFYVFLPLLAATIDTVSANKRPDKKNTDPPKPQETKPNTEKALD